MLVQLRRALTGRVRWLLYPVVAILALIAVGAMYESIALVRDEHRYSMPGRSYEVAGHRLHLNCTGTGSPTVIFESGLGETSPVWARITARVDGTTRVCTYDRAGQGWSGDGPGPQDGLAVASDLHTLLARAHEDGPYVLVGHSVGGSYAMIYAAQYPNDVAGMVLLDSASPYQFTALPDFSGQYAMSRRLYGVLPSIARIGLWHAFPSSFSSLPEPAAAQIRAFETSPRQMRNSRDENSMFRRVFEQAQSLRTLAGKPLVVVTASESLQKIHGWSAAQDRLATLTSNSEHRVVEATHVGLLIEKRPSAASANAIAKIVQSVRTSTPVTAQ